MDGSNLRHISNLISCLKRTAAKVDIFKPNGVKLLVKSTEPFPNRFAKHQKGAGRLLDNSFLCEIQR
jgi:hypothetical protein